MQSMLGKKWDVLEVFNNGIIGLPSPDGSQEGKWYFPDGFVVKISGVLFLRLYDIMLSMQLLHLYLNTIFKF